MKKSNANLVKNLTTFEAWGLSLVGYIRPIISIPAIFAVLGDKGIYVWLPAMIVAVFLCFQVEKLGKIWPEISGGVAGYITKLAPKRKFLGLYAGFAYLLGWSMILAVYSSIIVQAVTQYFGDVLSLPSRITLVTFFILIAFVMGFSSIKVVSILNSILIIPTILLLVAFGIGGSLYLFFDPSSPGFFTQSIPIISFDDFFKWSFYITLPTFMLDVGSVFTGDSLNPQKSLKWLKRTTILAPIVMILNPWVLSRLADRESSAVLVYKTITEATAPFFGEFSSTFSTTLLLLASLLLASTSILVSSRIIYQLSKGKYIHQIFGRSNEDGVIPFALILTMIISLSAVFYNDNRYIVLLAGGASLSTIVIFNYAIWFNRKKLTKKVYPRLSLVVAIFLSIVLVYGGLLANPLGLVISLSLPLILIALNSFLRPVYDKIVRINLRLNPLVLLNLTFTQIISVLSITTIAVLISFFETYGLGGDFFAGVNSHIILFLILSFVGIAITSWTTIPKINDLKNTKMKLAVINEKLSIDIQKRQKLENQLNHNLLHDHLTGLYNRKYLNQKIDKIIRSKKHNYAVMFLDLDRFKLVNDTMGHELGDKLLQSVADNLRNVSLSNCTLVRLGGDEFIVVMERIRKTNEVVEMANKILNQFRKPILFAGRKHIITSSIGIVFGNKYDTDLAEVISAADIAMYESKTSGRNRYTIFSKQMREKSMIEHKIEGGLRKSLKKKKFLVEYQPVFEKGSEKLVGFEALLRWKKGNMIIPPKSFLKVAEEIGMLIPISEWIINKVVSDIALWNEELDRTDYYVSVNLSENILIHPNLKRMFESALKKNSVGSQQVKVEILENSAVENNLALNNLRLLKEIGIESMIDDFGTGYSNLSQLQDLPVSVLKIDQTFVRKSQENGYEIMKAIIKLAKIFELKTVVEGIETKEELEKVKDLDFDYIQGFVFHKPVSKGKVVGLFADINHQNDKLKQKVQA